MSRVDEVYINGDMEHRVPHNLNLSFAFVEGESLIMALKGIAVSSGSACTSASLEPSYVLRALGKSDELAHSSVRFSIGRFTTTEDIDSTIAQVTEVVQRLRENRDDLYIMSMPPRDLDLSAQVFLPNPLVVLAPRHHALTGAGRLPLADLAEERFILREGGSGTRLACDAHFQQQGFRPRIRMELGSNEAIKQAVVGGMGLAVLSRHAIGEALEENGLAILDIEGFPIHASWYIVYPRGKRLSPSATAFLQQLQAQATQ